MAVAGMGLWVAAVATTNTAPAPTVQKTAHVTTATAPRTLALAAMPSGTVTFVRDHGRLEAKVAAFGFTPGSVHALEIDQPNAVNPEARFYPVTATSTGQVSATATSFFTARHLATGSVFVIRLGNNTGDFNRNPVAAEAIATTRVLPADPAGRTFALHGVSVGTNGVALGRLGGTARLVFDATQHTLTITVNATGFAPNSTHAAHIQIGTCRAQGPVNMKYMFGDLTADAHGDIVNQVRIISGVTAPPPADSSYLNIHQGDSNSILVGGAPARSFRPLLCANI